MTEVAGTPSTSDRWSLFGLGRIEKDLLVDCYLLFWMKLSESENDGALLDCSERQSAASDL